MKFGSTGQEPMTWAMNTFLPGVVCERFHRSRIAAFSTGNVYGLVPVERGGSSEEDTLNPAGEYAMSCVGRERILQHFSLTRGTPVSIIRLNYACDLRYGVLVDIAQKVWNGQPVDVRMGYFNTIWQGDALAHTVQALTRVAAPPFILNVTGSGILEVRDLANRFGERLGKEVEITGTEAETAWLNDASLSHQLFGQPRVSVDEMIDWIATWLEAGGGTLGKPTHFETRDGNY
ncbi:MAG: NAD(P)-dependent oxidoreductase, partial [Verrucomicrobiae bacterium]|nr:NAD(P)-dependent oxidoreductase [Verrucomicrobiae bacterium]